MTNDKENENNNGKDTEMDVDNNNKVTIGESPCMSDDAISLTIYHNQLEVLENELTKYLNQKAREKECTIESQKEDFDKSKLMNRLAWVRKNIITTNDELENIKQHRRESIEREFQSSNNTCSRAEVDNKEAKLSCKYDMISYDMISYHMK